MKSRRIIIGLIITNIILIGVICNFISKNVDIIKEKQIIKEMSTTEYDNEITELNKSHEDYAIQVQNNKQKIATAITEMGVETSEEANVDTMVNNIKSISTISEISVIKSYYNAQITQSSASITIDQDVLKGIVVVFLAAGDNTQNAYTTSPSMSSSNTNTSITKLDDKSAKSYSGNYYSCSGRYTIFQVENIKSGDTLSFSYSTDPASFTSIIVIA